MSEDVQQSASKYCPACYRGLYFGEKEVSCSKCKGQLSPTLTQGYGPGRLLGDRYVLSSSRLGKGSYGHVYKGFDTQQTTNNKAKPVAIKILIPQSAAEGAGSSLAKAKPETTVLASIDSPFVVQLIKDVTHENGTTYFIMEFLEGKTLEELLREVRPPGRALGGLDLPSALGLWMPLVTAVMALHAQKKRIVHRDLKPANIMVLGDILIETAEPDQLSHLASSLHLKLLDFGSAKQQEQQGQQGGLVRQSGGPNVTSMLQFTKQYAAPEQRAALDNTLPGVATPSFTAATDVFTLAVIFLELLPGQPLTYSFKDEEARLAAFNARIAARPAGMSTQLAELLKKCLMRSPKERPQDAAELLAELDKIPERRPLQPQMLTPVKRSRLWWLAIGAGLSMVLVGSALAWRSWSRDLRSEALSLFQKSLRTEKSLAYVIPAAGRSGEPELFGFVIPFLGHHELAVRERVAQALPGLDEKQSREPLGKALASTSDRQMRLAIASALSLADPALGCEGLHDLVDDKDAAIRSEARFYFVTRCEPDTVPPDWMTALIDWTLKLHSNGDNARDVLCTLARQPRRLGSTVARAIVQQRSKSEEVNTAVIDAIYCMGKLYSDEHAIKRLRLLAKSPGPHQIQAARRLAELKICAFVTELSLAALDRTRDEESRIEAIEGLAVCGMEPERRDRELGQLMGSSLFSRDKDPLTVRIAAAAAYLLRSRDTPRLQGERWGTTTEDTSAAVALGEATPHTADLDKVHQSKWVPERVRSARVLRLGCTAAGLKHLDQFLSDPSEAVRVEALRSLAHLIQDPSCKTPEDTLATLRKQHEAGTASEKPVVALLLNHLGKGTGNPKDALSRCLKQAAPNLRALCPELWDGDRAPLEEILADASQLPEVQLNAAIQLKENKRAVEYLVRAVSNTVTFRDIDRLRAFAALLRMGKTPEPPLDFAELFQGADLATRFELAQALKTCLLSSNGLQKVLPVVIRDASGVVRAEGAIAAFHGYQRTKDEALRHILDPDMLFDSELTVREKVRELLMKLQAREARVGSESAADMSRSAVNDGGTVDLMRDGSASHQPDLAVANLRATKSMTAANDATMRELENFRKAQGAESRSSPDFAQVVTLYDAFLKDPKSQGHPKERKVAQERFYKLLPRVTQVMTREPDKAGSCVTTYTFQNAGAVASNTWGSGAPITVYDPKTVKVINKCPPSLGKAK